MLDFRPLGDDVEFLTNATGDRMLRIGGMAAKKKQSEQAGPVWRTPDPSPPGLSIFPSAEVRWTILDCGVQHLHRVQLLATGEDLDLQFNTGLATEDLARIIQARQIGDIVELHGKLGEAEHDSRCRVFIAEGGESVPTQLIVEIESMDGKHAGKLFASTAAHDYLIDYFALHVPRHELGHELGTYHPVYARLSDDGVLVVADGKKPT